MQVFLKMMGLPLERSAEFRDLVHEFHLSPAAAPTRSQILRRQRMVADAMIDVILRADGRSAGTI